MAVTYYQLNKENARASPPFPFLFATYYKHLQRTIVCNRTHDRTQPTGLAYGWMEHAFAFGGCAVIHCFLGFGDEVE